MYIKWVEPYRHLKGLLPRLSPYNCAAGVAFTVIVLPFLLIRIPPLADYANHLARLHILATYRWDPVVYERYVVLPELPPNLAMDLLATPIAMVFGLIPASKGFLALIAAVYCWGCHTLRRTAVGSEGWLAIPMFFTLFSSGMLWGFANYVAGLAVFLCAFSWWVSTLNATVPRRRLKTALWGIACYLCHLTSYGFFFVAVFSSVAYRVATGRWKLRQGITDLIPIAAAGLLFVVTSILGTSDSMALKWSSPREKLIQLTQLVRTYDIAVDASVSAALVLIAAAVYSLGARTRVASPELFWSGISLFVLYLALPYEVFAHSASGVDVQLVQPAVLLLLLSLGFEARRRQLIPLAHAGLLLVMLSRHVFILWSWNSLLAESHQLEQLTADIAPGSSVFVAHTRRTGVDERSETRRYPATTARSSSRRMQWFLSCLPTPEAR